MERPEGGRGHARITFYEREGFEGRAFTSERSVRFLVPLGPGSGVDITARLIADKLSAKWGKPVVVENKPGGDAIVAITAFTGANDDHTLLMAPTSTFRFSRVPRISR